MAKIIVVTSGKGGVGKSSCCALLGQALATRGKRTLLLEMDSGLRGLDIMLGNEDKTIYDLADVLEGRCEPIKALAPWPGDANLSLIPAPFDPDFVPNPEDLVRLTKGFSLYFDFVLVDTPAGLGRIFTVCSQVADQALMVVTPDPICVRDGARVADLLYEKGVPSVRLIINRVGVKVYKNQRLLPDLDQVIDDTGVQLIGVVPLSQEVHRATATGGQLARGTLPQRAYDNIAARLCGQYVELAIE